MAESSPVRSRADVTTELEAAQAEHGDAKGQAKAKLTRVIKRLEAELAAMPAEQGKRFRKGVFDSAAIVAMANSGQVSTAEELADALGLEITPAFRRRISWLVTKDGLIGEQFLVAAAVKQAKAKPTPEPTPDLAAQLGASVKAVRAKAKPKAK